jgi:LuxR family maltose regulon positive regulatory protein
MVEASPGSGPDIPLGLAAWLSEPGSTVTLLLDDFHEIRDPVVLAQVEALVEAVPDRLQIFLGCRADPQMPLHRWRLRGLVAEVRAAELSFTIEETAALLRAHQAYLPVRVLAELTSRTEGWPAGLRLAALELARSPDPEQRLGEFFRHDRGMADYLLDEVIRRLPADVVEVLTCTALLDEVDADLISALTGRDDGATVLEALERANSLVTRLTRPGEWYRYHPLLRQILMDELSHRQPGRVQVLHQRAAAWYSRHGPASHAIRHHLAAREWSLAVEVLTRSWPDVLTSSRRDERFMSAAVPEDLVSADADLALAFAADRLYGGDPAGLHTFVRVADRLLLASGEEDQSTGRGSMIAAFRLVDAQLNGDRDKVLAVVGPILATEPEPLALLAAGESLLQAADFVAALEPLTGALAVAEERGLEDLRLAATSRLAVAYTFAGRLTEGDHAARTALMIAGDRGRTGGEDQERARIALAQIGLERFELNEASHHLDLIMRARPPTSRMLWVLTWTTRLRVRAAAGDPAGASVELRALRRDVVPTDLDDPPVAFALSFIATEFELAAGHHTAARRQLAVLERIDAPRGWTAVMQARLHLAERQPVRAAAATAPHADPLDPGLQRGFAIELVLIHAWALLMLGNQAKSGRSLETALRLAGEDGFRLAFHHAGDSMADLLRSHIRAGTAYPAVAAEVLAMLTAERSAGHAEVAEPLSEREVAVLRHVQDVMSNLEIATAMSVSVNTVKTHLKNIYRKLGTDSRRDAVRRAQSRGEV